MRTSAVLAFEIGSMDQQKLKEASPVFILLDERLPSTQRCCLRLDGIYDVH
jgi:hypothetical protein